MLFCPDLPHKLLFLSHFPSYGLTSVYSAIPVLLSSCLLLVHCCSKASCANVPKLFYKGHAELQEPLRRTEAICAGTNVMGNIAGPLFSQVLCSSVHFYSFEKNISQNLRLEISGDIQYQLFMHALWSSTWMLSSTHPLSLCFLTMALSQWDEVQNHDCF